MLLQCNTLHSTKELQNQNTSATIPCNSGRWKMMKVEREFKISTKPEHLADTPEQKSVPYMCAWMKRLYPKL